MRNASCSGPTPSSLPPAFCVQGMGAWKGHHRYMAGRRLVSVRTPSKPTHGLTCYKSLKRALTIAARSAAA